MSRLDARLLALERHAAATGLTVIVRRFGLDPTRVGSSRLTCGGISVERRSDEAEALFRERALAEIGAKVPGQAWGGRVAFEE